AITNICNAKCDFCWFAVDRFDPKQRRSVPLKEAEDVIAIAAKNHIGYLLLVGGEPLAHKALRAMVRRAADTGIAWRYCTHVQLSADGAGFELLEFQRFEPGQLQDGGIDRRF